MTEPFVNISRIDRSRKTGETAEWNSGSSLLELAYKLKQAEFRVFGRTRPEFEASAAENDESRSTQREFPERTNGERKADASEEPEVFVPGKNDSHFSSLLDFSFDDFTTIKSLKCVRERYRMFRASFPRSYDEIENVGGVENSKNTSASATSSSPADAASTNVVNDSPTHGDNATVNRRHPCDWCSYQTDCRSHLIRHQKAVHRNVATDDDDLLTFEPTSVIKTTAAKPKAMRTRNPYNIATRKYKCDMCVYSTDCVSHLRRHQGCIHSKSKPYWCYVCRKEFSRSEKTKSHFVSFHPDVPYDPRKIRKVSAATTAVPDGAATPTVLSPDAAKLQRKKVRKKNGDGAPLDKSCYHEEETTTTARPGQKGGVKGRRKRYGCAKCNYVCNGLWHLKRHVSDVHATDKEYGCRVCRYAANHQHRLVCHMRSHGELFCPFCDYSSAGANAFRLHLRLCAVVHRAAAVVRCHVCRVDCVDAPALKAHVNEAHSPILHSCDLCPYYTAVPDEIYAHSRMHLDDERLCRPCDRLFDSEALLVEHVLSQHVADDGSRHRCVACGHATTDRNDAYRHVQRHVEETLSCGHDRCNFKCTIESSRALHWKYYHDDNVPELTPFDD